MTSRERCAGLALVETPQVALSALVALRAFLERVTDDGAGHGTLRAELSPQRRRSGAMRTPTRPRQLEWADAETMHWEDLPADVRACVRDLLGRLLRRIATAAPEAAR